MSGIIDFIERMTPVGPKVAQALDLLLPLLVSALLITALVQVGRVSNVADEAKMNSEENAALVRRTAHLARALHEGLVDSCRRNGNPLRRIVRVRIERELALTSIATLEELFPGTPQDRLETLLAEARRHNLQDITALEPVPCANQFR